MNILLLGDETGQQYAESMMKFTQNSNYASQLANGLLDVLTNGEHRKVMTQLLETQRQRFDQREIDQSLPDVEKEKSALANVKIDFEGLRSLSDLGLDMEFIDGLEKVTKCQEVQKKLETALNTNSALIEKLHGVQYDRLSQNLPAHLMQAPKAGGEEVELATKITSNLTDMAKNLTPEAIAPATIVRKAIGVGNGECNSKIIVFVVFEFRLFPAVGLDGYSPKTSIFGLPGLKLNRSASSEADADTTAVPMELETDQIVQHTEEANNVESELKANFLEASDHDTNSIDMLLEE